MNLRILLVSFLILLLKNSSCQDYDVFFTPNRYRINYTISGSSTTETISEIKILEEMYWGGSKKNLIDTFEYGAYLIKVFDYKSNKLIYSRGFSNLFHEWQTTINARKNTRTIRDCFIIPAPKNKVSVKLYKRDSLLEFKEFFQLAITPKTVSFIETDSSIHELKYIHQSAVSEKALDIVFISEGYSIAQKAKFFNDVERFKSSLFSWEPYTQYQNRINIAAVYTPSLEEGTDIPHDSIWIETALDCSLSTFGIERYLTVPDITQVYDLLNGIAVDQVCVLVNSDLYAGGGIYNNSTVFTADHYSASFLFVHEFGHSFAGLADEYSTAELEYTDKVNLDLEPVEPNITTLVDFESKWSLMVNDSTPIPTPDSSIYNNSIGAFEGAAYQAKGIYRSEKDCAMRSASCTTFCKVCSTTIENLLQFYTE